MKTLTCTFTESLNRIATGCVNHIKMILVLTLMLLTSQVHAAAASSGITYTGRILDSSDQPVTASQVYFTITISDPDQKCWLYTEQRLVDMSASAGNFAFEVGSNDPTTLYGTPSLNNPLGGGPATFADIFDNSKSFSNLAVGSYASCTGTYDPSTATDKYSGRVMAIFFRIGAAGTDQALPALRITPVPLAMQAINSVKVNGYDKNHLLKIDPSIASPVNSDINATQLAEFFRLVNAPGTAYLSAVPSMSGDVTGTVGANTVGKIQNVAVTAPTTGDTGKVLTYNGTNMVWQTAATSAITSINGSTTAAQSFAVGTSGTDVALSTAGATHTINIPTASGSNRGALSSADWTTFNSKQSSSLGAAQVWIGNASGVAAAQTLSGDATVSASGNVTVDKTQTAQASKILQLDSSGNAYVNGLDIKGSGAVSAQLRYTGASNMVMNLPTTSGTANQFLQTDGAGNWSWASQSAMLPAISAGQVWVGNSSNGAQAFSLSGDVASVSNTGLVTLTASATGANKLPLAGGSMSGAINMGGNNITNAGDVSLAAGKFLGLGAGSTDGTVAGQIWYDSGVVKYFDGTTTKTLGVAGAGITNLNGLTAGTQSFVNGSAGNAPAFSSSGSAHTLDIPMASASGSVTAGLISNADYVSFSGKQSSSLASAQVWVGNASGAAQARALSGDITVDNVGLVTANKTTTGQANKLLSLDGSSVGNMAGLGLTNTGTVTISAQTASATYGLKLPAAAPANNQILKSNASGDLSWVTYLAQVTDSAPLTNGKMWIGNASGVAGEVAMSGDATIDNAGLLTLKNTGSVGTYTKVVTDAQGRVTSGSALSSSDVTGALGYTPVNKAGDTMSGDLNTQNINMAAGKFLGLGSGSTDGTVAGQIWYDSGVVKYFDGTTAKALGVAGAGITNLNGLSVGTQSFVSGTAGTDFAISSSGSAHTFNLPSASATNRGALTSADWSTFNAKQSNALTAASVWVGNSSGGAEARALSGDVTISNVGLVTLKNTGSVGSYYKVVTDAQGRVVSGSTSLSATDMPALNDGTIWIGNSGNTAVGYAMSGDATMSNVGLVTLKNTGSVGTYSKVVTDAQGRVVSGSALSASDVTTALGYTPVNKAGDTMSGALAMGANDISNTGNISMAANKYFGLSANGTDGTVAGQMWYDSGVIKYFDGTTVKSLGVSGAGITTLNGLSSVTQSFVNGTSGNAPAFSSAGSAHTLNIPMASASGSVTAGLISNADYVSFSGKQSSSLAAGQVWVGNASGVAQAFSLSGDVATVSNTGLVTVNKTTTGQSNYIMALDGSGVANAYGVGVKGATSGTVTLQSSATTANYSVTLPAVAPANNQILQSNGSGVLSWVSNAANVTDAASLSNGKMWIGNASGIASEVAMSGDATISNVGLLTLKNTGSVGTYSKVVTDAQGRVVSGSALASGDVTTALGYTPVNRAGDSMSGDLITQNLNIAAGKFLGLGSGSTDGTVAGQMWYDSGVIKYFDGTTAKSLGVAGSGITNLNGLSAGTQSFVNGTAGNAPAFSSAGSAHTLNIPMASASGSVTAGLLSNAEYVALNGKQSNALAAGQMWVGNSSGGAQAFSLSGDIASVSNTGLVTVNKSTTGQSNYIMALDGSGVANAYGFGIKGATSGVITLQGQAAAGTYSLTFPNAQGGANQVLSNDGSGNLSWATALTGITNSASLTNGKLWVGNASGKAAEVNVSGDATMDNAGVMTLKNTGTVGTYFKVVTDAQGRVTSGSALASGDVTAALTYTPVNRAGDSMSGDLTSQNINMVANKYFKLSANSTDGTVAGQMWYDTGVIKYFDGTTTKSLGVSGAGITTLNGLSTVTQTFAVGTAGSDFAISSSGSGHTFNLPSASASNRGALTSADWSTFNAKQTNSLTAASVWVGNSSGGAEARALSGDVTISNVGLVTLKNTGSIGTYYKVVTDAQGRVVSGTSSLSATDLPSLTDGKIWIGNSGNTAVGYAMSGDATMSNVGLLTLKNTGSVGTYFKVVTDAQGRVTSGSALASGDVTTALGFTPVNRAGDTMAGALNFGGYDLTNSGNISMAANKYFGLSANSTNGTVAGQMWYDSGTIKYYDGTTTKSLGVAGAGITNLNGLSAGTQSFAIGTSGNSPAFSSATSTHTLNIPMASASGSVTAGLLSNAEYVALNAKQTSSLAAGQMWVGNASGVAQAFSLSGDVASVSNTGSVVVNKTTTGQSNYIMALDGSGVANAYGFGIKGATSGVITLQGQAAAGTYSLTFPNAQGGANQVLSNNGSGSLSWVTALTTSSINNNATLTNGKFWMGNGSGVAAEVAMSGDATISNAGLLTLKNTGTVGTYWKVVTDAQGRVTSGSALASGDVTTALGFTPVNVAGDTMTGDLGTQNINMAANKYLKLSANTTNGTVAGQMWYDTGTIKYYDGSTVKSLGVQGAGITTLNGLTAVSQTFVTGTSGSDFNLSFSGSTHTFNLPSASSSNRGALTSADWTTFNSKQSNSLTSASVWVGNSSGGAEARALSGDVTISNVGLVTLKNTGSVGTYFKVVTDAQGRVASGTSTLSNTDLPTLADTKIWIGNSASTATPYAISGDATMSNVGLVTLKNTGTVGTYWKVTTDAQGRVTSGSALASGDVTTALGFTPLNKAGDTMSGALAMGANDITNTGAISMANNKYFTVSNYAGAAGTAAGQLWYDSGSLKYYNGSTAVTLAATGAAITSLNGLTSAAQTFAIGTSGNSPAFSSATNTHTLNIPMASASGSVTAGLLSNAEYVTLSGKQSNTLASTQLWVGNSSGGAQARTISGDITIDNVGLTTLKATGTAGTYHKVITDAQGRVTSGFTTMLNTDLPTLADTKIWIGNGSSTATPYALSGDATMSNVGLVTVAKTTTGQSNYIMALDGSGVANVYGVGYKGATSGTVTLQAAATTSNYTLKLPSTTPTANQVMASDASGNLSWATALTSANGYMNGGNTFAGNATIGLNDAYTLGFETSGTTRMTITAAGNVGIGTATPNGTFQVSGGTAAASTTGSPITLAAQNGGSGGATGGTINLIPGDGTGGWPGGSVVVDTDNGENGGLTVGNNFTSSYATSSASNASPSYAIRMTNNVNANSQTALLEGSVRNSSANYQESYMGFVSNAGAGVYSADFVMGMSTGATAYAERLRVQGSTGYVGIGTTSLGTMFTVNGALEHATNFPYNMASRDSASAAQNVGGGIGFQGAADAADRTFAAIQGGHESATASSYDGFLRFFTRVNGNANLSERMRISSTGKVGIGTSTFGTNLLEVNGTVGATGANMSGTVTSTVASASTAFDAGNGNIKAGPGGTSTAGGGQIYAAAFDTSATTTTVDFNKGNIQTTSYQCAANITLNGMQSGGSYTLVVQGSATTTACNFVAGTGGETVFSYAPANTTRTANKDTVYTLIKVGTKVYISWIPGF